MRKSSVRALVASGLVSLLAFLGCGSDNHGGDPTAAIAACNAYCYAYIAAKCTDGFYLTEDECKTYECGDIAKSPSMCFVRYKAYYDCTSALSNADLCADMSCETQYNALFGC